MDNVSLDKGMRFMIEIQNLYKSYGNLEVLKDVSFSIKQGDIFGIIGQSGAGKSTLLRCFNGLESFQKGEVVVDGKAISSLDKKQLSFVQKEMGMIFQNFNLLNRLNVYDNIALPLKFWKQDPHSLENKQRIEKLLKLVGLEEKSQAYPRQLSGGQKQRVTLAGAMVGEAEILLFDEPLASLDPATGKSAIELIDKIQKENKKTIIIIEHRLEDVLHCNVDRIIVVNNGEIVSDIKPKELLSCNLLTESGIREPLYISALKYAGCEINPQCSPEHIDKLNVDVFKEKLADWYKSLSSEETSYDNESILRLEDISFGYSKEKEILHGVSFDIKKGEMVSIVGKNGAGKSTISKLICGFYKPTSGRILFKNEDIAGQSIKERADKIGIVMQNPNQMISKAMIFDEVALGLKVRGIPEDEIKERVYNTLKICGLYEFRNWPISALSFGQKKRVTIASILVLNPEVIILDEPTAGQDFKHYTEIMEFLRELNKSGVTIVMITHDMHLMLEYTNRAIVLSNGKKLAEDTAANILTNENIIKEANLKETSLYALAVKSGIEDPREFVRRFINYDRRIRGI
mgnify:CR=1 FL=1